MPGLRAGVGRVGEAGAQPFSSTPGQLPSSALPRCSRLPGPVPVSSRSLEATMLGLLLRGRAGGSAPHKTAACRDAKLLPSTSELRQETLRSPGCQPRRGERMPALKRLTRLFKCPAARPPQEAQLH